MTRDNLLFAIIGMLLGFLVGFMFASNMSQRQPTPAAMARNQPMPADHPPIGGEGATANQGGMQADVQADLDKARKEPNNFDAQVKAAGRYYQIQMYDQAIDYLVKANQLQPDDYQVIALLGEANMDAGHFEPAERWYKKALLKRPDDLVVLDALCAVLLQQGKAKEAEDAIAKLAKGDPNNQDLPQFREKLANLKPGKK